MNNMQTEKNSNKKNNQRGNYQGSNSQSTNKQNRSQDSDPQERGGNQRQDNQRQDNQRQDSNGGAMSMIPVAAISSVVTSQLVDNFAPRIFEDIKEYLVGQFGEEKVETWMNFFNGEESGDETAIYTLIRNAVPSLPEEFSLSNIMDWQPIKSRVTKSPIAAAAAVAAGVGALYLTREMLKGGSFSFSGVSKAMQSGKAKLSGISGKGGKKQLAGGANQTAKNRSTKNRRGQTASARA